MKVETVKEPIDEKQLIQKSSIIFQEAFSTLLIKRTDS